MKCMTTECDSDYTVCRGLCKKCYDRLQKRVARGKAKWGDLIAAGECTKARHINGLTPSIRRATIKEAIRWRDQHFNTLNP